MAIFNSLRKMIGKIPVVGVPFKFTSDALENFDDVFDCEKRLIRKRRKIALENEPQDHGFTGLCISGGGIRSATFSLGVMQAFNKAGVFRKFDYLSAVSGGGYIGSAVSWLYSELYRKPSPFNISKDEFPIAHANGARTTNPTTLY